MSPETRLAAFKNAIAGRYLIDAEIGRGGMAVVYVARDVRLARRVAVKVLDPRFASSGAVTAFGREVRHTVRLEHPNILPVFDVGEAEGLPFYVMRYVFGGSLRGRLERDRSLSLPQTARIIRQTADALAYAHARRILHCDIKPENLLLEGDHVYLADFGVSRAVRPDAFEWGANHAAAGWGGTAAYVSPEQALGERAVDARSDLYSLACVTYEMLAGRPLFTGRNDRDIVARRFAYVGVDAGELPRAVPGYVRAEIARALALAPDRRPDSVSEFAAGLEIREPVTRVARRVTRALRRGVRQVARRLRGLIPDPLDLLGAPDRTGQCRTS